MVHCGLVFVLCVLLTASALNVKNEKAARSFPADFNFGTASAAYQIEGAWDEDGKGWSIWDYLVRTDPSYVANNDTGDISANSYHNYKRDIQMMKELGVTHYRFSISWPRILPYGRANYVEPRGIAHYNNFINELIANDIIPFATMYHWDLPQNLSELGGWTNEEVIEWFADYARVLYQHFGDRVKNWFTINEPYIHCYYGYGYGVHAPRVSSPGILYYECGRNILLAHARAYQIYNEEFRSAQNGQVGIVISSDWVYPASDSPDDIEAAEDYLAFHLRQFADPIFSETGNFPQRMRDRVEAASLAEGLNSSRLRPFTQEQIELIRGSSDFFALNSYTSKYAYRNSSLNGAFDIPSTNNDAFLRTYMDPEWPNSVSLWIREHGPGMYHLLMYIKNLYNNPVVYITENGFPTYMGLNDDGRVSYLRNYLDAILDAIDEGADVQTYFFWSLFDNFEWTSGFTQKFGLYEVDMEDPERTRTPRKSALVYKEIVNSRTLDFDYNPDPYETDGACAVSASLLAILAVAVFNVLFAQ